MVKALAEAGQPEHAETLARSTANREPQSSALVGVAKALAEADQVQQAERVARSVQARDWQVLALADVAQAVAAVGHTKEAAVIATEAKAAALSIIDVSRQEPDIAGIRQALATRTPHSSRIEPDRLAHIVAAAARALAAVGDVERAV